jgi:integrase
VARKRQRGNGAGTVYPRKNKDGKVIGYRGSYFVDTAVGPKRLYVSGRTKTETEKALRKATADRDGGLVFDASCLTLGSYLDRWLPNIRDTVRQRTWERYEQIVRVHIKPTLGKKTLKNLTPTHVRGLYRLKLDKGSSARTVQYIHTTLRKALRDAASDGLVPRNVTDGIKAPRPKKKEINPLDPKQAKAFLDEVHEDRLEALYVLAVHRGLRQGELLGLKWEDVDLQAGMLQVRRTLSLTKNGHVFEQPKNGKGRSIELTEAALEALRSHLKRQLEEIETLGDAYQDQGLIFPGERGQPMRPWTLTRKLERILKRAGLPHIRFHDLRHTCATLLLSKGVHPKFVQELLGHATISITLDTYSRVIPAMGDQTRKAMEDVLM